jgi:antitoxin component YwqK of YwqJK toxin-antitoxin module/peroxiredoxin
MRSRVLLPLLLGQVLSGCATLKYLENHLLVRHLEDRYPNGHLKREGTVDLLFSEQEGLWIYYHENGQKAAEGHYLDNMRHGPWTSWYDNGQKETEGLVARDRLDSEWVYWYRDGTLRARGDFEDGLESGAWYFRDASGSQEGELDEGRPVLRWTYKDPNGQVKERGYLIDGLKLGPWEEWNTQQNLFTERLYHHPAQEYELCRELWSPENLRREGFLRHNKKIGRWITYHQNGKKRAAGRLGETGKAEGRWTMWSSADGALLASGEVLEGRPSGTWRTWVTGREEALDWHGPHPPTPPVLPGHPWSQDNLPDSTSVQNAVLTWLTEAHSELNPAHSPPPKAAIEPVTTPTPVSAPPAPSPPKEAQPLTELEISLLNTLTRLLGVTPLPRPPARLGPYPIPDQTQNGDPEKAKRLKDQSLLATLSKDFRTPDGKPLTLPEETSGKLLLMVILTGFRGKVCPYCTSQVRGLEEALPTLAALNTTLLFVYPGPPNGLAPFLKAYRECFGNLPAYKDNIVCYPPLEFLKRWGLLIDADKEPNNPYITYPSSVLFDDKGTVVNAYVGTDVYDRPSAKKLIEMIEHYRNSLARKPLNAALH